MILEGIKAFAFDIDGVATDGSILCTTEGDLLRVYDAKDGFAIRMAVMNGYPVGVITGGSSDSIRKRMVFSGVKPEDVYLHCRNKMDEFGQFCEKYNLDPKDVMYFGDDVPDIEVMLAAGCGVCPSDAVDDVKAAADIVSTKPGGKGCLREVIEKTLRAQGKWVFDTGEYKRKF
jgi:3-deoxy-D-manno-octulosonate 8-phosphate phosphatase (KDO 8-P phosphatase)